MSSALATLSCNNGSPSAFNVLVLPGKLTLPEPGPSFGAADFFVTICSGGFGTNFPNKSASDTPSPI